GRTSRPRVPSAAMPAMPATAARAAWMVVKYGTSRTSAVRRIKYESAVDAASALVVFTTIATSPASIASTQCGLPCFTLFTRRDARERHARRLGHERHRARRARVHLEDVQVLVAVGRLHGELHVHQADDAELARERPRLLGDERDHARRERERRQRARRVARM